MLRSAMASMTDGAEPASLRRRHARSLALGPAHGEGAVIGAPADIDETAIRRERPIFPRVGGKLVERKPDRLRGSCLQAQPGPVRGDTRTNEAGEGRELGTNQILDLDPVPLIPHQQVLVG